MNKRERVLAAMNLEKVDRPPVGFWFHFPPDKGRGEACVQAHLDYYNHIDVDMVKIMCDGYFDYPNPVAKAAKEPKDWKAMKPLGKDSPFIREQVERARRVREGLKDEMAVIYNVFAPFSLIRFGAGDELVMRHIKEDPDAVMRALDVIAEDVSTLGELLVTEAGIDGMYYCVQGGEKDRFSVEDYRRLITPSDVKPIEHVNRFSTNNVLHCCGWAGIPNNVEVWRDYPVKTVNWACFIEKMRLAEGRKFFDGKCVLGGFDNRPRGVLYTGAKEDVKAETKKLIWEAGSRGVILGADCTLPADIDVNRLTWVIEAANECAR